VPPGLQARLTLLPFAADPVGLGHRKPQAAGNRRAARHRQPERVVVVEAEHVTASAAMSRDHDLVGPTSDGHRLRCLTGGRERQDALEHLARHFVIIY